MFRGFFCLFPEPIQLCWGKLEVGFTLFFLLQVEEFGEEFDATRSTGYLCGATIGNFEQVRWFTGFTKGFCWLLGFLTSPY